MGKTARPSGLTLTRKDRVFTAKWKIAAKDYDDGQGFQYRLSGRNWKSVNMNVKQTQKSFEINLNNYFPTANKPKLKTVSVRVRGNQKAYRADNKTINPSMSEWNSRTFTIKPPAAPKLTATVGAYPSTRFSWTATNNTSDDNWLTDVQYESVLLRDSNISKGEQLTGSNWKTTRWGTRYSSTGSASSSLNVVEDTSRLADGHSYTRWIRCRSRGPAGVSAWRYAKHVYANSRAAVITKWKTVKNDNASGYLVQVWFDSPKTVARPIDKVDVEYTFAIPDPDLTCPDSAVWNVGTSALVKDKTGGAVFSVDQLLNLDQCLFVRVNTIHDEMDGHDGVTYGTPVLVDKGNLKAPERLSVDPNPENFTATVTATNISDVTDSYIAIKFYSNANPNGVVVGSIPSGETSAIVQCPEWETGESIAFGVYAVVGDLEKPDMTSAVVKDGGVVPLAPANVNVTQSDIQGTITVSWDWTWTDADRAEISWSDHADAWISTDQPRTYEVTKMNSSTWNISGLATGQMWYVRVRLISGAGDTVSYGAYSPILPILLSSAPAIPVLSLSEGVIQESGEVVASWIYSTIDNSPQAFAVIAEVVNDEYVEIMQVESSQQATIVAAEQNNGEGWQTGESHAIVVKVTSTAQRESQWSDPVNVLVAEPPVCTITQSSIEMVTLESENEQGQTITYQEPSITALEMTVTVTGAGENGTTTLIIERAAAYHVDRPDETEFNGFEGETIYIGQLNGEGQFIINQSDLIGRFDDGAAYRLIATVQDENGQSATATSMTLADETVVDTTDFEVHWSHQAKEPDATVEFDKDNLIATFVPIAPAGAAQTDVCDIYRLSADKPELIIEGATFGTEYVDPYPTISEYGGYRFVTRTENGDYITEDMTFAWLDVEVPYKTRYNIIDFDDGRAFLEFNVDLSSAWQKDFTETKYLGGSVQGDWNPAVSRTGSVNFIGITLVDEEIVETMRRLAVCAGICHVRTKDGSNYMADVQVSENYNYAKGVKTSEYSLRITRVDKQELDGMTKKEWDDLHQETEQ